jgi:hypothetical protein
MTNVKQLKILIVDYSGVKSSKNLIRCCFSLIYFFCFLFLFYNETGTMTGNKTQQGPLEQLGETLGGVFGGGGNQSQ